MADYVSVEEIKTFIEKSLQTSNTGVTSAARAAGVSPRTLQRRLAQAGVSYSQLVDEVRFTAAQHLLAQDGINLAVIASLLGYADPGSFTRAFERWTGQSPTSYRESATASCRTRGVKWQDFNYRKTGRFGAPS